MSTPTASALDAVASELVARLGAQVARDAPSAELTTYRCGGPLAVRVQIERVSDLDAVASALATAPAVEVLVIGRGSNLLVADAGFRGVALVPGRELERLAVDTTRKQVDAGAAVALPVLARRAAAAGVGGLEFYVGIPGSVGGAVRMNAGGHGDDTAGVLQRARIFDLDARAGREVGRDELGLGYRRSALGPRLVVTGAVFQGTAIDPAVGAGRIDEIVRWRREHQPGGQNAGSVFVNPPDDSAGRIIDACGLKGLRVGRAVVSEKHANFFAAEPGARADDVAALVREVQRRVEDATAVRLVPELRMIGFREAGP